ncbi:DUF938 domain-containing protein [Marinibactrum halimedae]|uniref:Methylase n=1 Tax=Marinibactrum halimedae TaxID=1444977 RepID=A0AA37TE13_9GAMM|nr:DUF938 domain-containing protein [Marinibactrum halimedae]MCD9459962.1 class I SAM-dependent methyltransferase [Marinibactrum halimedae]GLS28270.1 methylase [Marinibactrum halimedae]
MIEKPFSQACQNNRQPILEILQSYLTVQSYLTEGATKSHYVHESLSRPVRVFEMGSGTGQHAVYFGEHLPEVLWQCADLPVHHEGINAWIDEYTEKGFKNITRPIAFDVNQSVWPQQKFNALFTANTLHIMSWQSVEVFFSRIREILDTNCRVFIYGPFNYNGQFTSESNAQFDLWLKSQNPHSGIRDFEAVADLAKTARLHLLADHEMPANNRLLVFGNTQR